MQISIARNGCLSAGPTGILGNMDSLWTQGYAHLPGLLTADECVEIRSMYAEPELFRSRINMKRYRFGVGEYQYFRYPLPPRVAQLRASLYEQLAPVAREWTRSINMEYPFPDKHTDFIDQCHERGQNRPTAILLRYVPGDYNCLHQDLYGELYFPFQVVVLLSDPATEYTGGELILVEQQLRAQSISRVVPFAKQGDAVVITTRYRPAQGARGLYRANIKHGVSEVRSGERYTLGLIFHDAP
ncbi:prolyl 4-hydroxylase [Bryobacterales bacterium F-183]|nr:prolyl 4-hydroxylase [Bryobacterales bacterium F-183]